MTALFHNIGSKFKENFPEVSGFSSAATITPLYMTDLLDTVLKAAIVAVVSGFVGAFVGHYAKKIIQKLKL